MKQKSFLPLIFVSFPICYIIFFLIMLIVDYENCIINYVTLFDHIINYVIIIIDYIANLKSILFNILTIQ